MIKFLAAPLAAFLLIASLSNTAMAAGASEAQMRWIKSALAEKLIDPESMRLSKVKTQKTKESVKVACGWVNSKNRMGGYAGRVPFIVSIIERVEFAFVISIGSTDDEKIVVFKMCSKYGISLQ
jgi:hypothetical protein